MKDFEFYNPVKIFFGKDQVSQITEQVPAGSKVILIYGGGSIFKNGVYDRVRAALKGFELTEFGGIEPNPTYETSMKAVEIIKQKKISYIIAAGGGSVIDATKFIAAAALFKNGDPWKILSESAEVTEAIPFGCILTLPATGTEMNKNSVISRKSTTEKLAFSVNPVFPKFSVLLPDAAGTLPQETGCEWHSGCICTCHGAVSYIPGKCTNTGQVCRGNYDNPHRRSPKGLCQT